MKLYDEPIENHRKIRVTVIGAGFSGIYLGIRIPQRIKNVDLSIFEKNEGFGGTWFENRYPGVACDIPSHSYQYSFCPNKDWSQMYAPGNEIQNYLASVAEKYSVHRFVKFCHQVVSCVWKDSTWSLKVRLPTGEIINHEADVLISARGTLNDPAWPEIEGLHSFKGKLVHSATWDTTYDFSNKRIGVIGSGSSAIQIVPQLRKLEGSHLTCFIRSQTWIAPTFGEATMKKLGMKDQVFTDQQRESFKDSDEYQKFRKLIERDGNAVHGVTIAGSEFSEGAKREMSAIMRQRLASRPDIAEFLVPSFSPGCRRLTPGPGFLEALVEDNVDFITSPVIKINAQSIETETGKIELDVLVCATGFNVDGTPPFPIVGPQKSLEERFTPIPETYLTLTTDGFPNFFMMLGPNSAIGSGSLTKMIEAAGDYITCAIRKLQKENIKTMAVKSDRVRDFQAYKDEYFKKTVYLGNCTGWYRDRKGRGNTVIGLWPGSTLHAIEAFSSPRWEDFEYTYNDNNVLRFLGNGWSDTQLENGDMAWYLEPEFVDIPAEPLPEETRINKIKSFAH